MTTLRDNPRQALCEVQRLVVKIGTRSILGENAGPGRFQNLADQIAGQMQQQRLVTLVSSGAVQLGCQRFGLSQRPINHGKLQAMAAAGQSQLMKAYEDAFEKHQTHVAQVLLTHADLADRDRYRNARDSMEALFELNTVPVINENGTVAHDELSFGDNDQLAAMVATLVGADLLILLSDVEGLLNDEGKRLSVVPNIQDIQQFIRPKENANSLGGMESKVDAAHRATQRGVPVILGDARNPNTLEEILSGQDVGTVFLPNGSGLASRKHWIAFTLKPRGALLIDKGAVHALVKNKRSLLAAGIIGVRGDFEPGDAVSICDAQDKELGRGLSRYSTREVARLAGAKSEAIEPITGRHGGDAIVHRDDLVMFSE